MSQTTAPKSVAVTNDSTMQQPREVVFTDRHGITYGVGTSWMRAIEDWRRSAIEVYRILHAERKHLHPRMKRQLRWLRREFGPISDLPASNPETVKDMKAVKK